MLRTPFLAILFTACVSTAAIADEEYLTTVTSEVYQTKGTPRELATRSNICISQHLAPGSTDSQLIISSDLDNGTIVARSVIQFDNDSLGLLVAKGRSVFTFEAREGRFRIEQTNLERFLDGASGWKPIGKWFGSNWERAQEAFAKSADEVAQCVVIAPDKKNW
jgi:hypothetical protein